MAKKITLKNKNGDVLCPHTAIEQVQGLKEALDDKLGKTEKAVSAKATKVSKSSEADPNFALSFYAGQAETSTTPTADKVYVGSSVDPNIISVPFLGGTTSMANYMNLRMSFNSRYFHEIAVLPNSDGIYHRNVRNGNAIEWEQLAYKSDVDSKLGKTEKAASATKLSTSTYVGEDLNTFNFTDGSARYYGVIPPTASNMPDAKGWQNSVMCFGLNENGATAQMFFAKDKPLYYRSSQTGEWQQIAYKSDVDKAFNYLGYNLDLNEFYDNENKSGIVYVNIHDGAENTINAPERQGSAVNFGAGASNFQLFSQANSNKLYHRNRWWSDGGGKWTDWKQLRTIDDKVTTSHIADAAITPAKIQTSIALNGTPSMTVEPTTSSPDKTIASVGLVKEAVDGIEIGGTNHLRYLKDDGSSYWDGGSGVTCDVTIDGDVIKGQTNGNNNPRIYNSSTKEIVWEPNTDYVLSYYAKGQGDYSALIIIEGNNVNFCPFSDMGVYSSEWKKYVKKFTTPSDIIDANTQLLKFYCGHRNANDTTSWLEIKDIKIERGNKATDWSPAPEDVQANISNAETRSKAHAEDYTNDAIDKIENGETVAQKANSLYDEDSNKYKNWGEIDTAITRKIGNKFEDYATKSYVQEQISNQVAVPIASETEYGKVELATPEDVTAVEADGSAVNNAAKAVTPYTLKEYIASKNFATDSDISSAVTAAKPAIFFQAAQPAGGKDGDIWIIP